MSFERWITRLASGYYSSDDLFPHVFGQRGCLFLLRVAQAPANRDAVTRASAIEPESFLWRVGYGLWPLVWNVEHSLAARVAAISAAPAILGAATPAARRGGGYMFWDHLVDLRGLHAAPGDEEEVVAAIRDGLEQHLHSSDEHLRSGAEHGLYHLDTNT